MWIKLMATPNQSIIMKNFATVLNAVITAAILFSASFIYNMNRSTGELVVKLEALAVQTNKLETKIDEMNNNYVRKDDFNTLEGRVYELEKRTK
jgi:hypothetical protein